MTRRETRFIGTGNTWIANGHYRGWKVTCTRCGVSKVITGHDGSSLPPSIIVKKLTQVGWYIGKKERDDLCVECRRKPKAQPHLQPADEGLVGVDLLRCYLKRALKSSKLDEVRRLIECALRETNNLQVQPEPIAKQSIPDSHNAEEHQHGGAPVEIPPVPDDLPAFMSEPDYDKWLAELDRIHHASTHAVETFLSTGETT